MRVKLFEKENVSDGKVDVIDVINISDDIVPITQTETINENSFIPCNVNEEKKQVKLAPIFMKRSKKQDAASLQAKRDFLHSGSPLSFKKTVTVQSSIQEIEYEIFPKISHVQQRQIDEPSSILWDLPNTSLCLYENYDDSCAEPYYSQIHIGSFSNCTNVNTTLTNKQLHAPPVKIENIKQLIQELKDECPDYPVYKIFRLLREKCDTRVKISEVTSEIVSRIDVKPKDAVPKKRPRGRPKKKQIVSDDSSAIRTATSEIRSSQKLNTCTSPCMWSEQYKPQSRDDIMGNVTVINELKLWLESWLTYSEDKKSKKRKRLSSNSSDDFCTDSDTRDTDSLPQNTLLLIGPHGSGKTSAVYALCNEFNINVIEINASSKRTGKKILSELQEATQSHQVKNTDSKSTSNFFHKTAKSKSNSEDDLNKKLSLLLVEDIDVVFEDQDEGLISALVALTSTSKRPIILTSTDPTSSHLQKFISHHRVLSFSALSGKILGTWLQILCLVEGVYVNRDMLVQLLHWNKGDVRKTILQLQFWVQSGGDQLKSNEFLNTSALSKIIKITSNHSNSICIDGESYQDETSNLSWLSVEDNKNSGSKEPNYLNQSCVQCFVPYYERDTNNFQLMYPVNLGLLWWNIPKLLKINDIKHSIEMREENISSNDKKSTNFSNIINQFKENETINNVPEETNNCIVSPVLFEGTQGQQHQMKQCPQKELADLIVAANVLESLAFADSMYSKMKLEYDLEPTFDYWKQNPVDSLSFKENMTGYDDGHNLSMDITHWLLNSTIQTCETIDNKKLINSDFNIALPDPENIRWRSRQHKAMEAISSIVPTSSLLDRKALCTDYHSIFRSISRMENMRFKNSSKRKNRFFHFFKNINFHLPDSVYKVLNNGLTVDKDTI
ncbi:enhanced level of genomic instability 1 [Carabus blaptoides fortunei]